LTHGASNGCYNLFLQEARKIPRMIRGMHDIPTIMKANVGRGKSENHQSSDSTSAARVSNLVYLP